MTSAANISPFPRELAALSARLGQRIELVQGPGGNTSIKDGNTLWIKASGKWLADAQRRNIFVPIDLRRARALIKQGIGDLASCVIGESGLRPSIETAVHALIEYPVVVHLHSINALAWAVRVDGQSTVVSRLRGLNWIWLDYVRPGTALATAFCNLLKKRAIANVILLGNHGLVICAGSVGEVEALIKTVEERLVTLARPWQFPSSKDLEYFAAIPKCRLPTIMDTHAIARDPLARQLASDGALYPDHAVFLGRSLPIVAHQRNSSALGVIEARLALPPYCVIVQEQAVLLGDECSAAAEAMLACCALVVLRQHDPALVRYLAANEVEALGAWEMEKFRKQESAPRLSKASGRPRKFNDDSW